MRVAPLIITKKGMGKNYDMLWTILAILLILWLLGFVGGVGSNIHLLLVIALVVLALQLITRQRRVGL
jgi:hypothetical protein